KIYRSRSFCNRGIDRCTAAQDFREPTGSAATVPILRDDRIGTAVENVGIAREKYQGTNGIVGAVYPSTAHILYRTQGIVGTVDAYGRGSRGIGKSNLTCSDIGETCLRATRSPNIHFVIFHPLGDKQGRMDLRIRCIKATV